MILNHYYKKFILSLIIAIVLFSYFVGIYYNSHLITSSQITGYLFEAISIVLTEHKYGFNGYQGKVTILEYLNSFSENFTQIDNAINNILENNYKNDNQYHLLYVSEVGYVDFIRNSFYLFGYKISSIYNYYYLIFSLSIILFIFSEYKNSFHLTLLLLLVFAIVVINLSFISTDKLNELISLTNLDRYYKITSVNNVRAISTLGIISSFNIFIYLITNNKFNILKFIIFILQIIIVIYLLRARFHLIWFIIPPTLYLFYFIFSSLYNFNPKKIFLYIFNYTIILIFLFTTFVLDNNLKSKKYLELHNFSNHSPSFSFVIGILIDNKLREKYTGYKRLPNKSFENQHRCINNSDKLVCKLVKNRFLKIIINKLHDLNHIVHNYDNDGYASAFKWLERNNRSYYELFYFNENDNINFESYFYPYTFSNLNKNKKITNKSSDFKFHEHFNQDKANEINFLVIKDMLSNDKIELIKIIILYKPLLYLKNLAYNFILFNDFKLTMLLLIMMLFIFYYLFKKQNLNNFRKNYNYFLILSLFFIGALSQNIFGSLHTQVINDSFICFVFIIFYYIFNLFNKKSNY